MIKKILSGFMGALAAVSCTAGAAFAKDDKDVVQKQDFEIFKKISNGKNQMISPFSIQTAMMMAANGAEGITQKEILDACGVKNLEEYNAQFKEAYKNLNKVKNLNVSNSIWSVKDEFTPGYKQNIKENFSGDSFKVDPKEAVNVINAWVEHKTKGKIKDIIPKGTEMVAALVNTVYFKGEWAKPFDAKQTREQYFTNADGSRNKVDFMHQTDYFNYYGDSELQLLEMKYKDSDISMYMALPREGHEITQENLNRAIKNKHFEKVNVSVPKIKVESNLDLVSVFEKLGVEDAFKESCTGFSNKMFGRLDKEFYISNILHKTFIETQEKGTEAAASTVVIIQDKCCILRPEFPLSFNANRPFTYLIVDNKSQQTLFMGEQLNAK